MTDIDENIIGEALTPKQELFCRFYTQNDILYGNATLSYAEAYDYKLDTLTGDDEVYLTTSGKEVNKVGLELLPKAESYGAKVIQKSTYQKAYDQASVYGSRMIRNDKVQRRCRELWKELMDENVIDARLTEIILRGKDQDSVNAIKEFNKLKQRIVEKKDITSGGEKIAGFNFIRATEEEAKAVYPIQIFPEPTIVRNDNKDNSNDKTNG